MKLSITAFGAALMVTAAASYAAPAALRIQDPTVLANGLAADQSAAAGAVTGAWLDQYRGAARGLLLDETQLHLHALAPRERGGYAGAKAQCWIDAARDERGHRNGWGFVEEATHEALALVESLQAHAEAASANPELRTSALLRPDLWERLAAAKASPAWPSCEPAQQIVACAEVGLMHAGHLAWTRAFGPAGQRVAGIEAAIAGLPRALQACAPPAPVTPVAPVLPPKLPLPAETLFEFDRSDIEGMLPEGRSRLDELAHLLGADSGVTAIHADGYTDRLGSDRYNRVLSQRRAETVVAYLRELGVTVPMRADGHGKANPVKACDVRDRRALIDCLAPNRRVELTFSREGGSAAAAAPASPVASPAVSAPARAIVLPPPPARPRAPAHRSRRTRDSDVVSFDQPPPVPPAFR